MRGGFRVASAGLLAASLVVVAGASWPDEAGGISLPSAVRGDPGQFVVVTAKTAGKVVRWVVPAGLNQLDPELLKDPKAAVFATARPGTYKVQAYSAVGDVPTELAETVITIGPGVIVPPDPVVPPTPTDPLVVAFQNAANLDPAAEHVWIPDLREVMARGAAKANDPAVLTTAALSAAVTADRKEKIREALPNLRRAIGDFMNGVLPTDNTALTEPMRKQISAAYAKVAAALGEVK